MSAPRSYRSSIDGLRRILKGAGVRVSINGRLPPMVGGRYYETSRSIRISPSPSAKEILLTLAHEAGHWVGYRLHGGPETKAGTVSRRREREAFVYGWRLLKLVGAPIVRREWSEFHPRESK